MKDWAVSFLAAACLVVATILATRVAFCVLGI
jgi:hypothetical protein